MFHMCIPSHNLLSTILFRQIDLINERSTNIEFEKETHAFGKLRKILSKMLKFSTFYNISPQSNTFALQRWESSSKSWVVLRQFDGACNWNSVVNLHQFPFCDKAIWFISLSFPFLRKNLPQFRCAWNSMFTKNWSYLCIKSNNGYRFTLAYIKMWFFPGDKHASIHRKL